MVKIEQRISNLERSNSSIHLDVANGLLEISTIKGEALRNVHGMFSSD